MNEPVPADVSRRHRLGCLAWLTIVVLAVLVVIGIVVGIGSFFNQGRGSVQTQSAFDAGEASAYQDASVVYVEAQHLYIVRLQSGTFIALYDKSSKQQELRSNCRVSFDDTATPGKLAPLPGIVGAFVENCDGQHAVWRADGRFAFGADYGNLDRYQTRIDRAGHLMVDTSTRTCTRSRGVIGVPPFDVTTCGRGD